MRSPAPSRGGGPRFADRRRDDRRPTAVKRHSMAIPLPVSVAAASSAGFPIRCSSSPPVLRSCFPRRRLSPVERGADRVRDRQPADAQASAPTSSDQRPRKARMPRADANAAAARASAPHAGSSSTRTGPRRPMRRRYVDREPSHPQPSSSRLPKRAVRWLSVAATVPGERPASRQCRQDRSTRSSGEKSTSAAAPAAGRSAPAERASRAGRSAPERRESATARPAPRHSRRVRHTPPDPALEAPAPA